MTTEILFPPAVEVQDEGLTIVDDMTEEFQPSMARGLSQFQVFGGPRLKLTRRVMVRQTELGKMLAWLQNMRGKGRRFWASVNYPTRGSFSDPELLSNPTFATGTTSWTTYDAAIGTLTAQERHLRATRIKNGNYLGAYQTPTVSTLIPYAGRGFILPGKGYAASNYAIQLYDTVATATGGTGAGVGGYQLASLCALSSSLRHLLYDSAGSGQIAGDYFDVPWASLSRCLQVDAGGNSLLYSDQLDNAAWTKAAATIAANSSVAPDGTTTADGIQETSATSVHEANQTITVSSATGDFTVVAHLKAGTRTWCELVLQETASGTGAGVYFDLTNGVAGSTLTGANWSNARGTIVNLGNGWYRCSVSANKTNASTGVMGRILCATANGTNNYAGTAGSDAVKVWRVGLNHGSFAFQPVQTTGTANAAGLATGNEINVKGAPTSTSGLLLEGDIVEFGGNLVMLTGSLDTDAAGCGWMSFGPSIVTGLSDGAPVIANYPLGRFVQTSDPQITNRFGLYGEITVEMEQRYS